MRPLTPSSVMCVGRRAPCAFDRARALRGCSQLANILPASIEHVLYLDGDVLAAHGPYEHEKLSPLKASFHIAVRRLQEAKAIATSAKRGPSLPSAPIAPISLPSAAALGSAPQRATSLRSAMAAVPGACTPEEFARELVHRQFPPKSPAETVARECLGNSVCGELYLIAEKDPGPSVCV